MVRDERKNRGRTWRARAGGTAISDDTLPESVQLPKKRKNQKWGRFLNFEKIAKLSKSQINVN
jgi:hypothetical protein